MQLYPYHRIKTVSLGRYRIELGELATETGPSPYSIVRMRPFACVAAFVEGRLALVRQYRHSVDGWTLELPAGGVEPGEDPQAGALRELREETGLVPSEVIDLGVVYPSIGSTDEKCYLFAVRCLQERVTCEPDPGEQTELVYMSREELEHMMDDGTLVYPELYVAWLKLQRAGLLDQLFGA